MIQSCGERVAVVAPQHLRQLAHHAARGKRGSRDVERVCFHFPGDDLFTPAERPHGLPIGSLTSQIWANVYLSPVDHLLGSHLFGCPAPAGSSVKFSAPTRVALDSTGLWAIARWNSPFAGGESSSE